MSSYVEYLVEQSSHQQTMFECVVVLPDTLRGGFESYSYFMVGTCSNNNIDTVVQTKCLDGSDSDTPVLGDNGDVYKNAYCAHCNGVNAYTILTVKCKATSTQKTLTSNKEQGKCVFDFDEEY